jgi:hypothetical protein
MYQRDPDALHRSQLSSGCSGLCGQAVSCDSDSFPRSSLAFHNAARSRVGQGGDEADIQMAVQPDPVAHPIVPCQPNMPVAYSDMLRTEVSANSIFLNPVDM